MPTDLQRADSVVIVGAGLGGLSAALHLAGAGRQVTLLEREAVPGGRCGLLTDGGYRFDTGPTVLTMPELLEQAFAAVGESLTERLTLHRLQPAYRARFADGSQLDVHADVDAMAAEIERTCSPADAAGYRRFVGWLRELYRVEMPHFIDRALDSPLQLAGRPLLELVRLGAFRRLAPKIADFVQDDRLRRIFSFQAMYAGLAPTQALAIYAVITYMDCISGVYFPEGGMHAVPRAMADAAIAAGVDVRYRTTATRIEVSGDRATAVLTADGGRFPADAVVVNADLPTAYATLLPQAYTPRRVRRLRYSPSAAVLHVGSRTAVTDAHHTISFGRAWDATFDELIGQRTTMSDPSLLVTSPTASDPSLAPPDRHTYYVLFPTPNLDPRRSGNLDWSELGPRYRDHMVATLEARGFTGFGDGIEVEHLTTPADWLAQGMAAGAPFAAAHTFAQTGPFRSAPVDPRLGNLLFTGSGTQPGVGVPMVLVSGRLTAGRITGAARRPATVLS